MKQVRKTVARKGHDFYWDAIKYVGPSMTEARPVCSCGWRGTLVVATTYGDLDTGSHKQEQQHLREVDATEWAKAYILCSIREDIENWLREGDYESLTTWLSSVIDFDCKEPDAIRAEAVGLGWIDTSTGEV